MKLFRKIFALCALLRDLLFCFVAMWMLIGCAELLPQQIPLPATPLPLPATPVEPTATPTAVPIPREPLIPTPPPITHPTATPDVPAPPVETRPTPRVAAAVGDHTWRFGVGLPSPPITQYEWRDWAPGWYISWRVTAEPPAFGAVEFVQMVRVPRGELRTPPEQLAEIATARPGQLWLISNEPDVKWQDDATPEQYARAYHSAYHAIKNADPTAQIAAGGISQATPLRIRYLELVREAFAAAFGEPMPADLWHIHVFVLREERDSWGVDIPPGMDDVQQGVLWEIEDHGRLDLVREQLYRFRGWMHEIGHGDKPLVVSEYGILMPEEYGFPFPVVRDFMWDSFDLFLQERDPKLGDPDDEHRLVQRWAWFSIADPLYPTGNLFHLETHAMTSLGEAYGAYLRQLQADP